MAQNFDEDGYGILRPIPVGSTLTFRNDATGATYPAKPENTMLASEETGERHDILKHVNSTKNTPYDAVNIGIEIPGGCKNCGRTVVKMQQLGEQKKAIYVCLCGRRWGN